MLRRAPKLPTPLGPPVDPVRPAQLALIVQIADPTVGHVPVVPHSSGAELDGQGYHIGQLADLERHGMGDIQPLPEESQPAFPLAHAVFEAPEGEVNRILISRRQTVVQHRKQDHRVTVEVNPRHTGVLRQVASIRGEMPGILHHPTAQFPGQRQCGLVARLPRVVRQALNAPTMVRRRIVDRGRGIFRRSVASPNTKLMVGEMSLRSIMYRKLGQPIDETLTPGAPFVIAGQKVVDGHGTQQSTLEPGCEVMIPRRRRAIVAELTPRPTDFGQIEQSIRPLHLPHHLHPALLDMWVLSRPTGEP